MHGECMEHMPCITYGKRMDLAAIQALDLESEKQCGAGVWQAFESECMDNAWRCCMRIPWLLLDAWHMHGPFQAYCMHFPCILLEASQCMGNAWEMHGSIPVILHAFFMHSADASQCLVDAWRTHGGCMADAWRTYRCLADAWRTYRCLADAWRTHGGRMVDHLNYVIFEPKSIALGIPSRFITWQNYAFYNVTELHISLVSKWQSLVTARNMATGTGKVRQGNGFDRKNHQR